MENKKKAVANLVTAFAFYSQSFTQRTLYPFCSVC